MKGLLHVSTLLIRRTMLVEVNKLVLTEPRIPPVYVELVCGLGWCDGSLTKAPRC